VGRDEIQYRQALFALVFAKPAAQLLQEDGEAFGGAQEQNGVNFRDIDTLVVKVHNKEEVDFPGNQFALHRPAFLMG